jgi:hypothetical protein
MWQVSFNRNFMAFWKQAPASLTSIYMHNISLGSIKGPAIMKFYPAARPNSPSPLPSLPPSSLEFPDGYGDAIIRSSDGVIFHFPRFLLSHVSPVFRDMYQLGDNAQNEDILTLTESYSTLEHLFQHIDPLKDTPPLIWDRVGDLLEAAEKYQVVSIFRWFEKEVALGMTKKPTPQLPNPIFCLALASRYELRTTAKLAVRQLIRYPISEIKSVYLINERLFEHLLRLRTARSQWLAMVILQCDFHYDKKYGRSCGLHPENETRFWTQIAMQAVIEEPSWAALEFSINNNLPQGCGCRRPHLSEYWKEKTEQKEAELPELNW